MDPITAAIVAAVAAGAVVAGAVAVAVADRGPGLLVISVPGTSSFGD